MKKLSVLVLLLTFILLLVSCDIVDQPMPNDSGQQPDNNMKEEIKPRKGGTLSLAVQGMDTWNPLLAKTTDTINFLGLIYEGVVGYDSDLSKTPLLASDWDVSDDGRLWTFNMRRDAKWHNGENVTAEDVIFTFDILKSGMLDSFFQNNIYDNNNILEIGLKSNDKYSFFVRLAEPSSKLLDLLTFPVLSKDYFQSIDNMLDTQNDLTIAPVGTGPYKVQDDFLTDDKSISLIRNEDWWGKEPYIDKIECRLYSNKKEARNAYNRGEVDVVDTMVAYVNANSVSDNTKLYKFMTNYYEFLGLNNESSILSDPKIREAMAYAIDRKEIISKVYLNNAETVDVPIPSNHWLYDSSYRVYDHDMEKAKKLLYEAGWQDLDGDGVLDKIIDNQRIELAIKIVTNSDNDIRRDALSLIKTHLELVGFKVETDIVDMEVIAEEVIPSGEFDVLLTGYYLDYAHDIRFAFHSNKIQESENMEDVGSNLRNFIKYSNSELDSLLDSASRLFDNDELKVIYQEIQNHMIQHLPVISLYFRTGSLLVDSKVHGVGNPTQLYIYRDIYDWFITD